jgi:Na+-transporting NADH:ubiquinone oxidoreductase subunit A
MDIKVPRRKGLNLPIKGAPRGDVQSLSPPRHVALHVGLFEEIKFKVLVKVGETVKVGQPLLIDKSHPERMFVSPAAGVLREIQRGLKRRLLCLVIERDAEEEEFPHEPLDLKSASREQLVDYFCKTGLFAHIRMRPFNLLAKPDQVPKSIFVKAVESAPFVPPAELQVEGLETEFQAGLDALGKLTEGKVHLVHGKGSNCTAFTQAAGVERHTVSGPHPAANHSLHIHKIDPVLYPDQTVWTANVHDVICMGKMVLTGQYYNERVIGIGGPATLPAGRGYFRVRTGHPLANLLEGRSEGESLRIISGNPLMGEKAESEEHLQFHHFAMTLLHEPTKRQFLHFLRLGLRKFSIHRAYLSGQIGGKQTYPMTTSLHGEERSFMDSAIYDRVMPMHIHAAMLVKAILSEDYDLAEMHGVLEVDAEDFALPTLICPSKVEMVQIVKEGLLRFAAELS